jgi:alpha-beta hydrolase superfamily lysophospholipase
VVLCSPFGHEEAHAHRAERHLAEDLAAAGFPALRFDYDATGDSAGDDREPGRVAAWRAGIEAAVAALREKAGVARVVLVGLRAGALLALVTAAAHGGGDGADKAPLADRLVLWNPVTSGRAHLKELVRLHKVLFPKDKGSEAKSDTDEALGFIVRKDTLADFGKLDAGAIAREARDCLSRDRRERQPVGGQAPREASVSRRRGRVQAPPRPPVPRDGPAQERCPGAEIAAITGYLSAAYGEVAPEEGQSDSAAKGESPSETPDVQPSPPHDVRRSQPRIVITKGPSSEQAWQFGGPTPRFGILTMPGDKASGHDGAAASGSARAAGSLPGARRRPAVILMNAGSIHRVGPNRSFVRMARRWADLGYPVLRMDLSGIGDSPAPAGCVENLPYPRDAILDAQAAMTALAEQGIAERFILSGLCSGADIAFRTGVIDPRVAGAWMINPQAFYFPSSDSLKEFMHAEIQATYYESAVWDLDRWKRMIRGEVDVRRIAGVVRAKVESSVRRRVSRLLGDKGRGGPRGQARGARRHPRSPPDGGPPDRHVPALQRGRPGPALPAQVLWPRAGSTLDGIANYRKDIVRARTTPSRRSGRKTC